MPGHYQRSSGNPGKRRRATNNDNDGDSGSSSYSPNQDAGIPYIEANTDIGEFPLDSVDTFVVSARDEKGQYNKLSFQLPPFMLQHCQIVVAGRRFPYLEVQDLVRHAVARHLRFLVDLRQSLPNSMVRVLDTLIEVSRDNDLRIRAHEAYAEIEKQIDRCMRRGETMEAVRMLNVIQSMLEGVPASTALTELRDRLTQQYNYVMGADGKLRKGR